MKLLSPVGNLESLKSAILGGADEVYLGVNDFNARNNIDGFTIDNLKQAVDYSHLFGVKVLLAVNILFSDEELNLAVDIVIKAYNMGVDAFIVQDLGLVYILHSQYPEIELHASTQMGIHNLEGVKEIEKFGFKRVVLARETPLSEIKRIRDNSDIEIEYFVHGALCVSFSGNCYLSSYLNDASGNRGRCKQLCRLPYKLLKGGKPIKSGYLLSAKDFDMSNRLADLKQAGVDVLKIEGRARRPYYVYTATNEYKKLLSGNRADREQLKLAFNRGFTEGYFNGNGKIISDVQNHIGIEVGKVLSVNNGKKFNEIIISSNRELNKKSTFKFFNNGKEITTLTAYDLTENGKGRYKITTTQKIETGYTVNLISDFNEENRVLSANPKCKLQLKISLIPNREIVAEIIANDKTEKVYGDILQMAKTQPLTEAEIIANFSKSELFDCNVTVDLQGDFFLAKKQLNEFRRKVFDVAFNLLTTANRKPLVKKEMVTSKTYIPFADFAIINNVNESLVAKNIVYSPDTYHVEDVKRLLERCRAEGHELYLDTPNFVLREDIAMLKSIISQTGVKVVANNYYALNFADVIGAGLNVYNTLSASVHNKPIITAEKDMGAKVKFPYMTLRFCPIKSHVGGDCKNCQYKGDFELQMESGKRLKIKRKRLSDCTFYLED